ncbi:MAG: HAMP domain-containing sensor histidine kinase [Phycisphaeraceae bacterium]
MSTTNNTTVSGSEQVDARLAHELSNLLDGSLRNVSLVMSMLRDTRGSTPTQQEDEDLLTRLTVAETGMRHMVSMLRQWFKQESAPAFIDDSQGTFGQMIEEGCALYEPAARAAGIEIETHLTPEAAVLPAGPLYPVLANALRNGIEAITGDNTRSAKSGRIDVHAEIACGSLRLIITDDGPGLSREVLDVGGKFFVGKTTKPGGHGIGMTTAKEIAEELGGTMRLASRNGQRGAVLTVAVPVDVLAAEVLKQR